MTEAIESFIEKCRDIVDANGKKQPASICGYILTDVYVFDNDKVRIISERKTELLEIVVLSKAHPDGQENPVVYIERNGRILRTHGEWRLIEAEIDEIHGSLPE